MEDNLETLSNFMLAAQTLTAIYGSPDGPTDPQRYYENMVELLDDPKLLLAQVGLANPAKFFLILREQIIPTAILS